MFFRTFLVVTLAAVSLVPGMAQGGDQAFDPLQLNIRLSPTALRPPSHLIKQQWTLDGYRLGRLGPQAPQAAVIEDDARRRLLILSATDEGKSWSTRWATCRWTSPLACARLSSVCAPASVRINGWTRPANSAAWPSACWSTCTSEGLRPLALPHPPSGRRGTRRRSLRLPPETSPTAGGHAAPPVVLPLQRGGSPCAMGGPGPIRDGPDAPLHSRHVRPHDHLGRRPGRAPRQAGRRRDGPRQGQQTRPPHRARQPDVGLGPAGHRSRT